jgi:hypothetical protein
MSPVSDAFVVLVDSSREEPLTSCSSGVGPFEPVPIGATSGDDVEDEDP